MREVKKCRICGNTNLIDILDLGYQELTGVFPKPGKKVGGGVLSLVKCSEEKDSCGLVQLKYSFDLDEMYGMNYGYRSGLNQSMVDHLTEIVREIERNYFLKDGDLVIDIGSNDGTTLSKYKNRSLDFLGMDPTGIKFKDYYPKDVELFSDFFSADNVRKVRDKKAKVITSIAMFYDLEEPIEFAKDVESVLKDDGVWIFEQSYLPSMIDTVSYDTVCHEHLEFYCLKQIKYIAEKAKLKIIDVKINDINGGSFRVTAAKKDSDYVVSNSVIDIEQYEDKNRYNDLEIYRSFAVSIEKNRADLKKFLETAKTEGRLVLGYGASTKGNVTLQYCGITNKDIPAIADVNEDKYGCVTPGTHIPIISEKDAWDMNPDYFVVLPWHFKEFILKKERDNMINRGTKFVFAFPELSVIGAEDLM